METHGNRGMKFVVIVAVLGAAAACDRPPAADLLRAEESLNAAEMAEAATYAAQEFKAATDAQAALTKELDEQKARWVPSYDKARELAVTAREAAEKAEKTAGVEKERVHDGALATMMAANESLSDARRMLERVSARRRSSAKIKELTAELASVDAVLADADNLVQTGFFAEAEKRAESAKTRAGELHAAIEQAVSARS